jgi:hypothetical protein
MLEMSVPPSFDGPSWPERPYHHSTSLLGEGEAKWADMSLRLEDNHAATTAVTVAAPSEPQPTEGTDDDQER